MPGVLIVETLAQAAAVLLLHRDGAPPDARVHLRGVDDAKFRRQVVPGDRVRVEVERLAGRPPVEKVHGTAFVNEQVVAEATLLLAVRPDPARIDPTAVVDARAVIGAGTVVGPHACIGPHVRIGRGCEIGASTVIDGWTVIGDGNRIAPMVSLGLAPQDLKYQGEETRLEIGARNTFREFVTIHRGTQGGGGVTRIGDHNLFMAYTHVAHDCQVGSEIIFGNCATLGGHVSVEDWANISAGSGIHQFCRVGRHAFVGGYSVVTKDAMPFARTVGNRARIYGLNTIGLVRRGMPPDVVSKLKRTYRYLLVSKLNTSRAIRAIEQDATLACPEVQYVIEFIRSSRRGVLLRRPTGRADQAAAEE